MVVRVSNVSRERSHSLQNVVSDIIIDVCEVRHDAVHSTSVVGHSLAAAGQGFARFATHILVFVVIQPRDPSRNDFMRGHRVQIATCERLASVASHV